MASRLGYTINVLLDPLMPTFSRSEPSTSNVLYSTRPPLTLYFTLPTTPTLASSWPVWLLTPGVKAINWVKLRPLRPISTTSFCVMVPETWAVSVSTPAAFCPCTSTELAASAGEREASTRAISPSTTATSLLRNSLKPGDAMDTVYEPAARPGREYSPPSLVTTVLVFPPASAMVTMALGKTAPLLSVTVPAIPVPLEGTCAEAGGEKPAISAKRQLARIAFFII